MARNVRVVTGPAYAPQDRAEAFADALTARALRSRAPQQGGPVQVAMNPWEGVAQLGEAGIAALLSRKSIKLAEADHQRKLAANDQMIRQLAGTKTEDRAPMATYGQQVPDDSRIGALTAAMAGKDPNEANQILSGQVLQNTFAKPKYERVDLGDSIGVVDESGNVVQRIPKGYTPDAQLREGGENARWQTPSGNARLGSQTTMRGQDIGAQTQMRGQDMTYGAATRGQDMTAETARAAQAAKTTAPSTANPLGLNDRQVSGMNTQVNAVLNYAANLTGMPRADVDAVLASEGPAGISRLINEKGGRFVQGRTAMALKALPFVGDAIVNMANPDIVAPVAAGAAGVAAYNNPAGMITNSDVMMGERQMPQPSYPLETQAQIIEQILQQGAAAKGGPQGAPQATPTFATEAEAAAAGLPPGTKVVIGGVSGTWQ